VTPTTSPDGYTSIYAKRAGNIHKYLTNVGWDTLRLLYRVITCGDLVSEQKVIADASKLPGTSVPTVMSRGEFRECSERMWLAGDAITIPVQARLVTWKALVQRCDA
jgi:hypothetical protein